MARVNEGESVRLTERFFNLVVASKTYHKLFANINLSTFNSGLKDLLILYSVFVKPLSTF